MHETLFCNWKLFVPWVMTTDTVASDGTKSHLMFIEECGNVNKRCTAIVLEENVFLNLLEPLKTIMLLAKMVSLLPSKHQTL